jgi:hypothetical protein
LSSSAYTLGLGWCVRFKIGQSLPQSQGIKLIDRKRSDAALRTSWATDQPFAAAARGIG